MDAGWRRDGVLLTTTPSSVFCAAHTRDSTLKEFQGILKDVTKENELTYYFAAETCV
ncbi:hypothetical protein JG688_00018228 [Phytophthora aleatoria]|uniref:Uncharacterized protein n=1 Tax=Phytophthora aleatoria TaxID=2496075 RepID=A0A8J5IFW3_9STRA|nr:hypothetical protein JG688_00018228 [Phytophthora aleatoria]